MNKINIYKKRQIILIISVVVVILICGIIYNVSNKKNSDSAEIANNNAAVDDKVFAEVPNEDSNSLKALESSSDTDITETNKASTQTETEISTENENEAYDAFQEIIYSETEMPSQNSIPVDVIYQNPELPTGCEITALTIVLQFKGYYISKTDLAENYLITADYGEADFDTAFIGDPETENAYGCYAPVICRTAQDFFDDNDNQNEVVDLTGTDMNDLCKLVAEGYPILVWTTSSLVEPVEKYVWTLNDGTDVYWMENEHCVVLNGYDLDRSTVTIIDPQKGIRVYDIDRFEERFVQLGKQAVAIY